MWISATRNNCVLLDLWELFATSDCQLYNESLSELHTRIMARWQPNKFAFIIGLRSLNFQLNLSITNNQLSIPLGSYLIFIFGDLCIVPRKP